MRTCLIELCYSLLDVITNKELKLEADDFIELRNSIDDTLLWVNVHMKTTKVEYKMKVDDINNKCESMLAKYNSENLFEVVTNKTDELGKLCYLIKSAVLRDILMLDEKDKIELDGLLDEAFDHVEEEGSDKEKKEETSERYITEINKLCDRLGQNMSTHMHSAIICPTTHTFVDNKDDEIGGVSIQDIKKMRANK